MSAFTITILGLVLAGILWVLWAVTRPLPRAARPDQFWHVLGTDGEVWVSRDRLTWSRSQPLSDTDAKEARDILRSERQLNRPS